MPALSLRITDLAKQAALYNSTLFQLSSSTPSAFLDRLSPHAAVRSALRAYHRVPAYHRFLNESGWRNDPTLPPEVRIRQLPETDKERYIKRFSIEERCLDGKIPLIGTEIDESSGSSGTPYNWVRSRADLAELHRTMAQFCRVYSEHATNVITINGFSMGAWATGVNVGEAMRYIGIVKSTGPDIEKIVHTLRFFGPNYTYVITGYPPFLKHLLDESEAAGFDWTDYRVLGVVGGESMSEGLRTYLERRFFAVYSAYGASDLDIGVGGETPLTVWIRKRAVADAALQRALFGDDPRVPMLFQYNPLDYYVETNEQNELVVTVNRSRLLSPRIRYNIHDTGGTLSFHAMVDTLREFGLDATSACRRPGQPIFQLPFLYLFGRSDSTLSYMGANIYPEDVQQALFADATDARRLGAYCLELIDIGNGEQRPCVHVEVLAPQGDETVLSERLRQRVLDRLLSSNRDFRSAVAEDFSAAELMVQVHATGQGPFANNGTRIKHRYIVQAADPGLER
ncbi:MAG: phenylacetate--CoA ligase family protein [Chloroflexota bacterium]